MLLRTKEIYLTLAVYILHFSFINTDKISLHFYVLSMRVSEVLLHKSPDDLLFNLPFFYKLNADTIS